MRTTSLDTGHKPEFGRNRGVNKTALWEREDREGGWDNWAVPASLLIIRMLPDDIQFVPKTRL